MEKNAFDSNSVFICWFQIRPSFPVNRSLYMLLFKKGAARLISSTEISRWWYRWFLKSHPLLYKWITWFHRNRLETHFGLAVGSFVFIFASPVLVLVAIKPCPICECSCQVHSVNTCSMLQEFGVFRPILNQWLDTNRTTFGWPVGLSSHRSYFW